MAGAPQAIIPPPVERGAGRDETRREPRKVRDVMTPDVETSTATASSE